MKAPHWFALLLLLFLGLMFLLEYHLPKKFVWKPTFSHYDHQPFGCAVFDDVLSASHPAGYSLSNETFYQLTADTLLSLATDTIHTSQASRPALLAIAQRIKLSDADCDALLRWVAIGGRVMLVASSFDRHLCDTLHFNHSYSWFQMKDVKRYAALFQPRDTLQWVATVAAPTIPFVPATTDSATTIPAPTDLFAYYPQLCNVYFLPQDSLFIPLVTTRVDSLQQVNYSLPSCFPAVAMRRQVGQGEVILVSTPLLFTNYGILDGSNADYLFRLLSQLGTGPIIRTEAYGISVQSQASPLRYFLAQPALRWALYLTVGVILLFMLTNARRRQRAIPIICPPKNRTLEFVRLIGTLYYQQRQPLDLVQKRFTYFSETLRRTLQVDVEEEWDDSLLACRIAAKTGMEEREIRLLLQELRPLIRNENRYPIDDERMKSLIDRMNRIIRNTL